jgi:hypothetical protein
MKVKISLAPADAKRLGRLAAQAVESLKVAQDPDRAIPAEEREALLEHRHSMQRILAAVKQGQQKLANEKLK